MKKIIAFILALCMVLSLAACGNKPVEEWEPTPDPKPETVVSEAVQPEEVSAYPMTVTDGAGREVVIEEQPEKIVSGYYISSSALIALGQKEKLVGIEAKADKRPIYSLAAPELIELPSVGTAKEFDLEGCAALEPDLVILPIKLKNVVETLESLGMKVLLVNPETQEQLEEMIALLAKVMGAEERGEELLNFLETQKQGLEKAVSGDDNNPLVYMAGNSSLLSTAGAEMYQSSMIERAGGQNVAKEIEDSYWVEVSYEQLLAWDPDYIVLASDASYSVEDVMNDKNLADCKAVKEGQVVQMLNKAEAWDSPVPGGILGSVWLASVLHEETVPEEQRDQIIDEFYETFYGFIYSEN